MKATLQTEDGRAVLRFERRLAHPPEKVWRALTDPAELRHWFPQDVTGTFAAGEQLRFVFRGEPPVLDGQVVTGFGGEVLAADPPHLLRYRWGEDVLTWRLTPDGGGCLLVFTDAVADRGKSARDGAGWHLCLDALAAALAQAAGPDGGQWQELYDMYASSFGPGSATAPLPE